jgi:hypothetical protein
VEGPPQVFDEEKVPPLRFAPVGMTVLLFPQARVECNY